MKHLVVVLALVACAPRAASPVDAAVASVLDDWHDAASRADEARYFGHFAEGAVFLGTDGTERWTVPAFRAYAHPHFAKGKAWNFRATHREITFRGDVAWFDEDLDTPNLGPARGSGVLVKDAAGVWKIAQYNLSVPIPNERFDDVKKLIAAPPSAP
jgi:ketosteroid isomerase-like protein